MSIKLKDEDKKKIRSKNNRERKQAIGTEKKIYQRENI